MYSAPSARPPLSHQGLARTDRLYLSQQVFSHYDTATHYIGQVTAIFSPEL